MAASLGEYSSCSCYFCMRRWQWILLLSSRRQLPTARCTFR